ncbi:hypothetical protein FQN60_015305, partial [Etheostoma spectabile]
MDFYPQEFCVTYSAPVETKDRVCSTWTLLVNIGLRKNVIKTRSGTDSSPRGVTRRCSVRILPSPEWPSRPSKPNLTETGSSLKPQRVSPGEQSEPPVFPE